MRALVLSLALVLIVPGALGAVQESYLSRTLDLDFHYPGSIKRVQANGKDPVSEQVLKNSYILILPKRIKLTLSIASDNEDKHHYHIHVKIRDERRAGDKVEAVIVPGKAITDLWLGPYRYRLLLVRKLATGQGQFVTAVVKLEVYTSAR